MRNIEKFLHCQKMMIRLDCVNQHELFMKYAELRLKFYNLGFD